VAQTNLEQQVTTVKQLISKKDDPQLDAATIVVTDRLPEPREADLPSLPKVLATAQANRPELREAQNNLQNQGVAIQYARNNQLPNVAVFGLLAGSGLQGNTALATAGAGASLGQTFSAQYPETAYGLSFSAPIRNRSAQADSARSQLERNQLLVGLQSTRNQVAMQVQQARIGLIQGKAQVEAAQEAVRLAQVTLDGERKKLEVGLSTSYNVVLRQRDLATAQYAEVQALSAYAKALVAIDQATGTTLDHNGIQLNDALSGTVTDMPAPPFHFDQPQPAPGAHR
jgi:outer membrane protein TolC